MATCFVIDLVGAENKIIGGQTTEAFDVTFPWVMKADVLFKEDKSKVTVLRMVNVTVWLLVNEEMVKVWRSLQDRRPLRPVGRTNQQRIVLYER